ncbi:hypothetical protein BDV40DRAFT_250904 [Aspergillus tamarii]|uniref:Uncharacterized protein n=1 Tax=Aspergillus tamarii TaxID=41984 RepID=A0A5N6VBK3_ASPTM|nr:hypothetical protein BDV40DRAFT_250904 [Aspergillus tamarii]
MDTEENSSSVWVLDPVETEGAKEYYYKLPQTVQNREKGKKIELHDGGQITKENLEKDDEVPLNGQYARINKDNVMEFWAPGGQYYGELAKQVYVSKKWMKDPLPPVTKRTRKPPASGNNAEGNGKNKRGENKEGEDNGKDKMGKANVDTQQRHIFARNQNGQAFKLMLNDRIGSLEDYIKRAIKSPQTGARWGRYVKVPARLYLVPIDRSDAAMKQLEEDVSKVQETDKSQVVEVKRATEVLKKLADDEPKYRKIATSPLRQYETWIEETDYRRYNTAIPTQPLPTSQQVDEAKKLIKSPTPEQQKVVNNSNRAAGVPHPTRQHFLATVVTVDKMKAKPETREEDQLKVMGESATEIAKKFGWQEDKQSDDWPVPRTLSEWLHRIAFSWGGLGAAGDGQTAQSRANLIFGSFECNSLMTRYERAWQRLVEKEDSYRKSINQSKAQGVLSTDIRRDYYTTCFGDNELQSRQPPHLTNVEVPHWICCAMDYSLNLDCRGLRGQCGDLKTTFYPLQRGFFTTFESNLDMVILERLYTRAKVSQAVKATLPGMHSRTLVKRPKPGSSGIPRKIPKPGQPSTSAISVI